MQVENGLKKLQDIRKFRAKAWVINLKNEYYILAVHRILKGEAGIAFKVMRKIHHNIIRFRDIFELDEAEVLAGYFRSVDARQYIY